MDHTVFAVKHLQSFEYDEEEIAENPETGEEEVVTWTVHEYPFRGYLRYLHSPDDGSVYELKFDLEITEMGEELLSRNPSQAEDWVSDRYDRYPEGFNPSDVNELQAQLEDIRDGTFEVSDSGRVKVTLEGGTFETESIETDEVSGRDRSIVTGTIETEDTLEIRIDDTSKLVIDTTNLA